MSYLVLARKYRPANFEEVVAQDLVVSTLKNAIEKGKVSHAYLFTGPRGSGKTTVARILAKALNCEKGPTSKPCNVCVRCKEINSGISLDVIEIDGASHNKVDDVRELNENVRYATASGKRIYIIDEVHMLTDQAFNALLKTLEEPPPQTVFILATTEVSKIPATILSRCQRFDFRRIPPQALSGTLEGICKKEEIEIEPEALAILVRKADGSLRDGLSLLDQVWTLSAGMVSKESVEQSLGLLGLSVFFELTDAFAQKDAAKALGVFDQICAKGADLEDFLDQLLYHLRNLLVVRWKKYSEELLGLSEPEEEEYAQRAEQFKEGDILRMMQAVSDLKLSMSRLTDPKILAEAELVKLAWLDSTVDLKEVLEELQGRSGPVSSNMYSSPKEGENRGSRLKASLPSRGTTSTEAGVAPKLPGTASSAPPPPTQKAASISSAAPVTGFPPHVSTGKGVGSELWSKVLEGMRKENPASVSLLEQVQPYFSEKEELILPFGHSYAGMAKMKFGGKGNGKKVLDEVLNHVFGRKMVWKMEFVANGGSLPPIVSVPVKASQPAVDDLLEKYPELKTIWDTLELEVLERKPNRPGADAKRADSGQI